MRESYQSKEEMYDMIDEIKQVAMSAEELLDALVMAMDVQELRENLEYVVRVNELEGIFYE
jgi:predicted RNase H-like nuclease